MRRPPSYSDSYVYLPGDAKSPAFDLLPITTPRLTIGIPETPQLPSAQGVPVRRPMFHNIVLFTMKGSLHIFFISSFETIFYFLYVSQSENQGILTTINTYYKPLIQRCDLWSNTTKIILEEILNLEINKSLIDAAGNSAYQNRNSYNSYLLNWSISYSGICAAVFLAMIVLVRIKQIPVPWGRLFTEHVTFVVLLGLYEYFFFRTIIYNYDTISTPELNQYLVDGAYQCFR